MPPEAQIKLIDCPRDAMQGIHEFIPTEVKVRYIQQLLAVGFDTLDVGSFVSPKAIPQMADTAQVLEQLDLSQTNTKLLTIVANMRGAKSAVTFDQVDYLGYPFSVSETFLIRNTNATIAEGLERLDDIHKVAQDHGKKLLVYLSMGFGNPYGDAWNVRVVAEWVEKLAERGVDLMMLSDTIGVSTPESISYLFSELIPKYPEVEIGAHLHTTPDTWREKVASAYESGCRRFDGALKGYGGCPMAADDLTGNMPTENIVKYLDEVASSGISQEELNKALLMSSSVFPLT
ncbi:MAG: hydroxymethylglutaryl-CoA lyase [Saprospiraceae bacterium]